jgi:hypothetical protein
MNTRTAAGRAPTASIQANRAISASNGPIQVQFSLLSSTPPSRKVAPAPALHHPRAAIEDAGEKIGGARKDQWAGRGLMLEDLETMLPAEAASHVKKSNIWVPDYPAMVAAGAEIPAVAAVKVLYDKLSAIPKNNTAAGRAEYLTMMRAVRDVLSAVKSFPDAEAAERRIRQTIGYAEKPNTNIEPCPARHIFLSVFPRGVSTLRLDYRTKRAVQKLLDSGFPQIQPWQRRLKIERDGGPGTCEEWIEYLMRRSATLGRELTPDNIRAGIFRVTTLGKRRTALAYASTLEEATASAEGIYNDLKSQARPKDRLPSRPHLDAIIRTGLPARRTRSAESQDFIRDFGFRGLEFGNWAADDERRKLLDHAYDALHDLAEILNVPPHAISLNGVLGLALGARGGGRANAHYEPARMVINLTKLRGAGFLAHEWAHALDHYFGELNRPDAYQTQPRAVTGWFVRANEATHTNLREPLRTAWRRVIQNLYERPRTYPEALADAEKAVADTTRQLSKYQASFTEFAKTPESNSQKLRNQWQNTLDYWRNRHGAAVKKLTQVRTTEGSPGSYGNVPTAYYREATLLCGKSTDTGYWARPTELWARAFESCIVGQLISRGANSQYLVQGVEPDRFKRPLYRGNPYPAEDRLTINAAIAHLIATLATRTSPSGRPALY